MDKPIVLITGVAGGIGSATAKVFGENGWHVIGITSFRPTSARFKSPSAFLRKSPRRKAALMPS
jgi:NAD(P)-dependent dehydrogenase (short-subunit alcohol dehydrogenase family)